MAISEKQKQERYAYIGGSDAAAVLGLSRYSTPLEVWGVKTGNIEAKDISDKIAVKLGNKLEQTVAELFMEATGKKVQRINNTLYHKKYNYICVNLDRKVIGEDAFLECKTTNYFKAKDWEGEDIPLEYIIQCYHGLAVSGMQKAYIAVLIGNTDFKYKIIERDEKVINDLIKKEVAFWNDYVLTNKMPMTIKANDDDVLYRMFPVAAPESTIELDDEANKAIENLDSLKADNKALEAEILQQENYIKALLKDNECGLTNKYKVTWKNQLTNRLDTKRFKEAQPELYKEFCNENKSRVFRFSLIKQKGDK